MSATALSVLNVPRIQDAIDSRTGSIISPTMPDNRYAG